MKINNRHSIRLHEYDYSQNGFYFLTICTKNRECLFGKIQNAKMNLSNIGKIVNNCWQTIPDHFPQIALHEYVIMPNHIHGIIEINNAKGVVRINEIGENDNMAGIVRANYAGDHSNMAGSVRANNTGDHSNMAGIVRANNTGDHFNMAGIVRANNTGDHFNMGGIVRGENMGDQCQNESFEHWENCK